MRIGIVAEGSYPYVSGGVASWVHMLVTRLAEYEFEIISIMPPDFEAIESYKYVLPANIQQIWLYRLGGSSARHQRTINYSPSELLHQEKSMLQEWFLFQNVSGQALELLGNIHKLGTPEEFFTSRAFWDIVKNCYQQEEQTSSFIDYFWMFRSMYSNVLTLLQQEYPKVDLVHAVSTGYAGLIASYMQQVQNIPFILTEHGIYSREREEEIIRAEWIPSVYKKRWIEYFHHLSRQSYHSAAEIITLFQRNCQYQEELGAPRNKLKIIPNGIQYERLSQLQIKPSRPGETMEIGAIVRVVPIKDIKTMIYAAKILADDKVDFKLTIMGPMDEEPEYAKECLDLVERLELSSNVIFTGQVDIMAYLPRFELLLLTSISEGQPLAILEGLAAGIPTVATNVGSCAEIIYGRDGDHFGQAGFIVPPVNPKAVAEKCKWLYENREKAQQFGQNGKRRVEKEYQLEQVVQSYRDIYETRGRINGRNRL